MRWIPPLTAAAALIAMGAPASASTAAQERATAVVLVNFTDSQLTDPGALAEKAKAVFFGQGSTSVSTYFAEASDDRVAFSGKTFGPWTLDMAATCDTSQMRTKVTELLSGKGDFAHVSIVFPNAKAKCGWGGLGTVGGGTTWLPAEYFSVAGTVHEIGHNLGLGHQASLACTAGTLTGCAEVGYRGKASVMGGGGPNVGLTAPELTALKWFPADTRREITGSGVYYLTPLHASREVPGRRIADIALGATGDRLVLEYRRKGLTLDKEVAEGVFAYLVKGGKYSRSFQVDASPETTTKGDTALKINTPLRAEGVYVNVTNITDTRARIAIRIG